LIEEDPKNLDELYDYKDIQNNNKPPSGTPSKTFQYID